MQNTENRPGNYQKQCKRCYSDFSGRRNKVYCSNQCKNDHNNDNAYEFRVVSRPILGVIEKNWKILDFFYNSSKYDLTQAELHLKGYNFDFFTHDVNNNGSRGFGIINYIITPISQTNTFKLEYYEYNR
jgi:hypothetical protein